MIDLDPQTRRILRRAVRQAHQKGKDSGRADVLEVIRFTGQPMGTPMSVVKSVPWNADDHPRDSNGRWITKAELGRADRDPAYKAKLEATLHPDDKKKFDRAVNLVGAGVLNYTDTPDFKETHDPRVNGKPTTATRPHTPDGKAADAELQRMIAGDDGQGTAKPEGGAMDRLFANLLEKAKTDPSIRKMLEDHIHPDDAGMLKEVLDGKPESAPPEPEPQPVPDEPKKGDVSSEVADVIRQDIGQNPKQWLNYADNVAKLKEQFGNDEAGAVELAAHLAEKHKLNVPENKRNTMDGAVAVIAMQATTAAAKVETANRAAVFKAKSPGIVSKAEGLASVIRALESPDEHEAAMREGRYKDHIGAIEKANKELTRMKVQYPLLAAAMKDQGKVPLSHEGQKAAAAAYADGLPDDAMPSKAMHDYLDQGGDPNVLHDHLTGGKKINSYYSHLKPFNSWDKRPVSDEGAVALREAIGEHLDARGDGGKAKLDALKAVPASATPAEGRSIGQADVPDGAEDVVQTEGPKGVTAKETYTHEEAAKAIEAAVSSHFAKTKLSTDARPQPDGGVKIVLQSSSFSNKRGREYNDEAVITIHPDGRVDMPSDAESVLNQKPAALAAVKAELSRGISLAKPQKSTEPEVSTGHAISLRVGKQALGKKYMARLRGTHPAYGFDRAFFSPDEESGRDHSYTDLQPGIYESQGYGDKLGGRLYHRVTKNPDGSFSDETISKDEAQKHFTVNTPPKSSASPSSPQPVLPSVWDGKESHELTQRQYLAKRANDRDTTGFGIHTSADYEADPILHERAVQRAIMAGKTVPPEVLADYPDLAAKYGAKAERPHTYFKGDKAEYTGSVGTDGLHELEVMEGHRKGQKAYTSTAPDGSNPDAERKKQEWRDEQAGFKRLHEAQKAATTTTSAPSSGPVPARLLGENLQMVDPVTAAPIGGDQYTSDGLKAGVPMHQWIEGKIANGGKPGVNRKSQFVIRMPDGTEHLVNNNQMEYAKHVHGGGATIDNATNKDEHAAEMAKALEQHTKEYRHHDGSLKNSTSMRPGAADHHETQSRLHGHAIMGILAAKARNEGRPFDDVLGEYKADEKAKRTEQAAVDKPVDAVSPKVDEPMTPERAATARKNNIDRIVRGHGVRKVQSHTTVKTAQQWDTAVQGAVKLVDKHDHSEPTWKDTNRLESIRKDVEALYGPRPAEKTAGKSADDPQKQFESQGGSFRKVGGDIQAEHPSHDYGEHDHIKIKPEGGGKHSVVQNGYDLSHEDGIPRPVKTVHGSGLDMRAAKRLASEKAIKQYGIGNGAEQKTAGKTMVQPAAARITPKPGVAGGKQVAGEPDPVTAPTTPVAAAVESAEAKGELPRKVAEAATKAADASDYEFARESSVANFGEDLKGSARHNRNVWRSLADAEKDGTAKDLVTRDNLLKVEPHSLSSTITPKGAMSHLAAHLAINAIPAEPGEYPANYHRYTLRGGEPMPPKSSDETLRSQYFEAYRSIRDLAQQKANESVDPREVLKAVSNHTAALIKKYRENDPLNPVAEALVDTRKKYDVSSWGKPRKNDVYGRVLEFAGHVAKAYPGQPTAETIDKLQSHVLNVMEGESFNKAFGMKGAGTKRFDPSEAYVAGAERKGGRVIDANTVEAGKKYMTDGLKLRGLQWGNYVTDDERAHHLAKSSEALADLADATGLPDHAISLGGKLGLAIGARGMGGARAHYEPDTQVINLTRNKGVGSLAHEWGHGLDHFLSGFKSFHSDKYPSTKDDPTAAAMQEVHRAMASSGYRQRLVKEVRDQIKAGKLSKDAEGYWASPKEMFARTFERHVQDQLHAEDRENTYLVGLRKDGHPLWPSREESAQISGPMNKLFAAIRQKHFDDSPEADAKPA